MGNHFTTTYGMEVEFRPSGRLSSPMRDRSYGHSRANPRNDPLALAGRQQQQVRSSNSHSPVQNNNAGGQRRRIPVAVCSPVSLVHISALIQLTAYEQCARCRKRKIRCSGDPGDNSGCTNCQSAHTADSCVFLRVRTQSLCSFLYFTILTPHKGFVFPSRFESLVLILNFGAVKFTPWNGARDARSRELFHSRIGINIRLPNFHEAFWIRIRRKQRDYAHGLQDLQSRDTEQQRSLRPIRIHPIELSFHL
jgi:hypothetical protein